MSDRTETLTPASVPTSHHDESYVDWSAIFAGTVVATAIAFVFTTFGTALGMSFISPYAGDGSATAALVAVGSWMLWTTISSFMAGGYITGRMRRRIEGASEDEVSVRDGIHGLAVWGAAVLIGAVLLGAGVDAVTQVSTEDVSATEAAATAEMARKYAIVSAFAASTAMFAAAAAAYWAASVGGQHRDDGQVFARFGRWT